MNTAILVLLFILLITLFVIVFLITRVIPSKLKTQESGQVKRFREILEREKKILEIMEKLVLKKQPSSIEELKRFHEQWLALAKLLENQTGKEQTTKITIQTPDGPRTITDINPQVRLRAESVESIEKTFKNSSLAPEMLRPFLNDPNNRVRANAVKAVYPYNPKLSIDALKQMSSSTDKWMRVSASWALGEIGTSETGEMLQTLLEDSDEDVKNKARLAIQKILNKKTENK